MITHYLSIEPIYISIDIEPVVLSRICWIFLAALVGEVVGQELAEMLSLPKGVDEHSDGGLCNPTCQTWHLGGCGIWLWAAMSTTGA